MWEIRSVSDTKRWIKSDGDKTWSADPLTVALLMANRDQPAALTPTAGSVTGGPDNPAWLWAAAQEFLPTPVTRKGEPPELPALPKVPKNATDGGGVPLTSNALPSKEDQLKARPRRAKEAP